MAKSRQQIAEKNEIENEILLLSQLLNYDEDKQDELKRIIQLIDTNNLCTINHRNIINAIKDLVENNQLVNAITTITYIAHQPNLQFDEFEHYIHSIDAKFQGSIDIHKTVKFVNKCGIVRKAKQIMKDTSENEINPYTRDHENIKKKIDDVFLAMSSGDSTILSNTDYIDRINDMENNILFGKKNQVNIIKTGFKKIDESITIMPKNLHVLAARPGEGKTAFASQVAYNVANDFKNINDNLSEDEKKKCVVFFSFEMSSIEIHSRLISLLSGINYQLNERSLKFAKEDIAREKSVTNAKNIIKKLPLFIIDTCRSLNDVETAIADLLVQGWETKFIVIDYIQQIPFSSTDGKTKAFTRENEVSENIKRIKNIARLHNLAIFALAQAKREVDKVSLGVVLGGMFGTKPKPNDTKSTNQGPTLGDVRESGQIEAEADSISFIYSVGTIDENKKDRLVNFSIKKNRNGVRDANIKLYYDPRTFKFCDDIDVEQIEAKRNAN